MLSQQTLFVIGAGASKELELPLGDELKGWIVDALETKPGDYHQWQFVDPNVETAVMSYIADVADVTTQNDVRARYNQKADEIRKALPFAWSIDQYLDSKRADPITIRLGKLGIAAAILRAERESTIGLGSSKSGRLKHDPDRFPTNAGRTWHLRLVQLLANGRSADELDRVFENTAFIVFNYDRCIEFYFSEALKRLYGTDDQGVSTALSNMMVIHPYGQVGALSWQSGKRIPFGGTAEGVLRPIAEQLRTFTESAAEGVISQTKRLMSEAKTVVFLGFGFIEQNLTLLRPVATADAQRVFFTRHGISASDAALVEQDVRSLFPKMPQHGLVEIFSEKGTCLELMKNNWIRLTRG